MCKIVKPSVFQRGLLSSSSCLNKPKGPVQRKHAGIKIQNISRLARMEQAPSGGYGFMRWWACSDEHFTLLFVCMETLPLGFFSLSYIYTYILNLSIFFKNPSFHRLAGTRLKPPLAFTKLTRSCRDLIKFGFTPLTALRSPRLHSAPAQRSLCLRTKDLYTYIYIFFFRVSCKDCLRVTFPPSESLQGQHRPDNTCSSELLLL